MCLINTHSLEPASARPDFDPRSAAHAARRVGVEPFLYNTFVDRNEDGLLHTCRGLTNTLDWTVTSNPIEGALDEAILNFVLVAGTGTRTVAVDANNAGLIRLETDTLSFTNLGVEHGNSRGRNGGGCSGTPTSQPIPASPWRCEPATQTPA